MIRVTRRIMARVRRRLAAPAYDRRASVGLDDREAGLTLIETIVALALAALVVAFLAQGAGLVRHFARLGRIVSSQDETLQLRDHLRRTVESAMRSTDTAGREAFIGVVDTMVFAVPGDRLLETGGPVRVTLAAVAEGTGVSLVETRAPIGVPGAKGSTHRLITGAAQVKFSYYVAVGGAPGWQPECTDPGTSPSLLRIDVAFPRGDQRRWPPFVVLMPTGGANQPASTAQPASAATVPSRKPG